MKTYAYSLVTFGSRQISIGRQGENLATRIDVDVTPWKTEYPTGTVSLFVVPPVGNGYLAAIEEDGNTIRWTIRDTDTAYDGHGKAELILKDASGTVMKSVTANTICAKSPSAAEPADPPEAIRPWVEQILEAIKNGVQVEETDPTVPDWAKQPSKPTYTASEVGALPSSYTPPVTSVNGKTGAVALSAQDVRARPDTWTPSASEVGADAAGTASGAVAAHNTSGAAHADLRALIEDLNNRLNALADSDDTTLDQLSEIVAYIKSNRTLIDAVTTGKVSVSDIVDNLTTNASGKVLSAAQGVALKAMIDGIVIPTALPNPKPITINGQHYDGSDAVTVTTAEIDDTLTQSGKAADAKAVGDQLSTLNEATAEEVGQLKSDVATLYDQTDALFALCLDGTPATYKAVMKSFFLTNGAASATPAELTALCDRWYTATRTGWDGGVKFYAPDVSAVSDGEKIGDNAGLTCVPSTNTVAGQDDYAGLPLFACVDVNWIVDPDTLEPVITAIDGITDSFDRYDPAKFVGVMQMSGYRWWNDDDTDYYLRGYCDSLKPYANIEPLSEAVRASDNSVRPWVVHAKYMAKVESGKFTCYSGVIPTAYSVSHNTSHTYANAVGSQYSGGTAADNAWLKLMSMLKYGSMTQDGVNQGCVQYNFQYPAAVAESGVQRVIIPKDQAANLIVGSSVIIGNYAGSLDRNNSGMYSITGQTGAVITSIQEVTIDGNTYAAVNVDCAAFDTVANGASATGTTYISTWHWRSGTCDNVLGNDGSPDSPGSGKYPAMIQGIEYSVGGYEVYADVILNLYKDSNDVYWYDPYLVNRSAQQSTGITSNYKATGLKCQQPDASNWLYIKKEGYAKGIYFPVLVGGSSSTYHRDGFYMNAASADTRGWLAFGSFFRGVGFGGLSLLTGDGGLPNAGWSILARLSPNGNRGEWAA